MRSFITAAILTIILIYSGIVFTQKIENIADDLSKKTQDIYLCLEKKDYEQAIKNHEETTNLFNKHKVVLEATSDHEELLRIELAYAQIQEFIKKDQIGDALACLSEIELLLDHLPGNFKLKPENIL